MLLTVGNTILKQDFFVSACSKVPYNFHSIGQSGIFARKYVKKKSLSDCKKQVFLSLIALLQHLLTVAIEENERIGDRNGESFKNLDMH